ncbi:MAG: hypothetical protein MJ025_05175 [Victivallaceae bacterium]|nr:hypothetical protein [Victivallaceae bacterium]
MHHTISIYEAIMLICFGASWPMAIHKTLTSKSHAGKSCTFSVLILIGYVAGMLHKYIFSMDFVFWLYLINALMVGFDLTMVLSYRHRDKMAKRF